MNKTKKICRNSFFEILEDDFLHIFFILMIVGIGLLFAYDASAVALGETVNTIPVIPETTTTVLYYLIPYNETVNVSMRIEGQGKDWIALPFSSVSFYENGDFIPFPLSIRFPSESAWLYTAEETALVLETAGGTGKITATIEKKIVLPFDFSGVAIKEMFKETSVEENVSQEQQEEIPASQSSSSDILSIPIEREENQASLASDEFQDSQDGQTSWVFTFVIFLLFILTAAVLFFRRKHIFACWNFLYKMIEKMYGKEEYTPELLARIHCLVAKKRDPLKMMQNNVKLKQLTNELLKETAYDAAMIDKNIKYIQQYYSIYQPLYQSINELLKKQKTVEQIQNELKDQVWSEDIVQAYSKAVREYKKNIKNKQRKEKKVKKKMKRR